jgi:hypothetical protein
MNAPKERSKIVSISLYLVFVYIGQCIDKCNKCTFIGGFATRMILRLCFHYHTWAVKNGSFDSLNAILLTGISLQMETSAYRYTCRI